MPKLVRKLIARIKSTPVGMTIKDFSKKAGLIYFGYIDKNSDDYKSLRGFTLSTSHIDDHYAVGTVGGYNVRIVFRTDTSHHPKSVTDTRWMIMTLDLKVDKSIPHFLIGVDNQDMQPFSHLFSSFPNMHPLEDLNEKLSQNMEFNTRFTIYARPGKMHDFEHLFPDSALSRISAHLWPLSVEQHNNVLYIYAVDNNITPNVLDKMLENGLWLAAHLDKLGSEL